MSTYLPGAQSYIPQIQPFTPDYNFYQGVLDFKQSKYDAAKQQLSTMYGSLLNAPLTREDNIDSRDRFFKAIEQDIQKMSGMDLSLQQNVDAAMGVFNQLTENKNIVHDMVWTKQFQNQYQKGQYLKNCADPEKCGGSWWEGGDRLMQYAQQEYKTASSKDALNMGAPTYVAHQNVMTKAMKLAKEFDLNISQDTVSGGYIVTTKNGSLAEPYMANMLLGTLGNDPKIAEYYKASAELQRKDFVFQNEGQYGSMEAAEQAYFQTILGSGVSEQEQELEKTLDEKVKSTENKAKQLQEKQKAALPDERSDIQKMLDDLQQSAVGYQQSLDKVKEVNHTTQMVTRGGTPVSSSYIDNLVANSTLKNDIGAAAHTLAYKDYEQSFKVDQYSLEAYKQANRMNYLEIQHLLKKDQIKWKFDLEHGLADVTLKGGAEHNLPDIIEEGVIGGSTTEETPLAGYEALAKPYETLQGDISSSEKYILDQVISRASVKAEQGDIQAQEDFINLMSNIVGASQESTGARSLNTADVIEAERLGTGANPKVQQYLNVLKSNAPISEKYRIAKQAASEINLNNIDGDQVDLVYDALIPELAKMDNKNKFTREYLKPVFGSKDNLRLMTNIEAKDEHLKQMGTWYYDLSRQVANEVRKRQEWNVEMQDPSYEYITGGSAGFGASEIDIDHKVLADAIDSYIGKDGNVVDAETFINNMVAKGRDRDVATALYKGGRIDPGFTDYLVSGLDAIPAAVSGAVSAVTGEEVGSGFDSATNVANWDAPGYRDDQSNLTGYGAKTIHDIYREAVSMYGEPNGDMAWLGTTGAGNYTAKGQQYQVVDPAISTSVAAMGMKGVFKDFNNPSSRIGLGGFNANKPTENNDVALAALNMYQTAYLSNPTAKNRPITTVTYSDIAGSDANTIGVNIKFQPGFFKAYKPTAKNPGMFDGTENYNKLLAEGITLYMNKDSATNLFKQASSKTDIEHLIALKKHINMDRVAGGYTDGFKIEALDNGMYKSSGLVQIGLDDQGKKDWDYFEMMHPAMTDVNDLVNKLDDVLIDIKNQNEAVRAKWIKKQMANI